MSAGTCGWCPAEATTTAVIAAAVPADPDTGTPGSPARTAPACAPCGARLEAQRLAEERRRQQEEHGSRLPVVDGQATLEQDLHARAPQRRHLEPGSVGEIGTATTVVLATVALLLVALAMAALVLAEPVHPHSGSHHVASGTSYSPCSSGSVTADGTVLGDGRGADRRTAASNRHPLGTRIRLIGRQAGPGGIRRYVIRDRIGHGSDLDLWTPSCPGAVRFGRRTLSYRIGWRRHGS